MTRLVRETKVMYQSIASLPFEGEERKDCKQLLSPAAHGSSRRVWKDVEQSTSTVSIGRESGKGIHTTPWLRCSLLWKHPSRTQVLTSWPSKNKRTGRLFNEPTELPVPARTLHLPPSVVCRVNKTQFPAE
eukprot:scaffold12163_cov176-Amphora_coffeaeformis.AAC.21